MAHVDALVLECTGGNLYDCVGLAVRAALATTEIQETEVVKSEEGEVRCTARSIYVLKQ